MGGGRAEVQERPTTDDAAQLESNLNAEISHSQIVSLNDSLIDHPEPRDDIDEIEEMILNHHSATSMRPPPPRPHRTRKASLDDFFIKSNR